jgi:MFS family permease
MKARGLPGEIWALGLGSLFMDVSSELIHSLLPLFLTGALGAAVTTVGAIEGVAEATGSITKVFSGALSDLLRRRKPVLLFGYALSACTKPVFPLASSVGTIFAARFMDRVGKGIRGAPRDALVAEIAPGRLRGAAYGLRQALDSLGAVLGPLVAVVAMAWLHDRIRAVMWIAVLPAFVAVALLALFVHEPVREQDGQASRPALRLRDFGRLPARYWGVVALGSVFTLARFSEAFLVLRAQSVHLSAGHVPLVIIAMNASYASLAYPSGTASDRMGSRALLLAGLVLLVAADLVLAAASSPWPVLAGAALWGVHMALTQGLLAKLVADTALSELRATAFGVFNLASGIALLLASVIAGALWSAIGPAATFLAGGAFAVLAALGLVVMRR